MFDRKAGWNPKGRHNPFPYEGVAGLRLATPSQGRGDGREGRRGGGGKGRAGEGLWVEGVRKEGRVRRWRERISVIRI